MAIFFRLDGVDVNHDALLESEKYLTIIFLILLLIANGVFIFFAFLKQNSAVLRKPKFAVRLSLALGGILLALFTKLIFTIQMFNQHSNPINCQTQHLARAYDQELLPMVYGCGLIILAIDVIRKSKSCSSYSLRTKTHMNLMGVFYTMIPWIIPLAVILPLILINVDFKYGRCFVKQSKEHQQARIVVSSLLPAGLALIFGVIALIYTSNGGRNNNSSQDTMEDIGALQTFDTKHISTTGGIASNQLELKNTNKNLNDVGNGDSEANNTDHFESKSYAIPVNSRFIQTQRNSLIMERIILLLSCFLFAICVIPFNATILYIMDNYDRTLGSTQFIYEPDAYIYIALVAMSWLRLLFPIILPVMWLAILF